MYGKVSGEAEVSLPVSSSIAHDWAAFLREVPLVVKEVVWTSEAVNTKPLP